MLQAINAYLNNIPPEAIEANHRYVFYNSLGVLQAIDAYLMKRLGDKAGHRCVPENETRERSRLSMLISQLKSDLGTEAGCQYMSDEQSEQSAAGYQCVSNEETGE